MNKNQLLNVCREYFGISTTNLKIVLLALLSCVGCNGQVNQKEKMPTKPTVAVEISETFKNGDSIILNQYKESRKDGLWREYYKNSQLKSEGSYTADLKEGLHKEWGDSGILLLEGFYTKGKANGLMKWFHERGHLAGEGNMIDDMRIGKWKICDIQENGFCIEAYFKNGKRDGIWKIYHENSIEKLWKEQTYKNDKMVSEKCWDANGKKIECK